MKRKLIPVSLALGLGITLLSAPCRADYNFSFTTQDFALEAPFWGQCIFKTVIENTGSQGDTVNFVLTTNFPSGEWYGDFCVKGKCYMNAGKIWLAVGEKDTIDVDIFVGSAINNFDPPVVRTFSPDGF